MQNDAANLEKRLAVLQNPKHRVTIGSSKFTPRYTLKRNGNIGTHKTSYWNGDGSIIYNSQQGWTTQMSTSWWMEKQARFTQQRSFIRPCKIMSYQHILHHRKYGKHYATQRKSQRAMHCVILPTGNVHLRPVLRTGLPVQDLRDSFHPRVGQIPWRRAWQPTPESMDRGAWWTSLWGRRVRHDWVCMSAKHML